MIFPGRLPPELPPTSKNLLIEPLGFTTKHPKLTIGKSLVRADPEGTSLVRLLSLADVPITIEKGEIIATAIEVQDHEKVYTVYNPATDTESVVWEDKLIPAKEDLEDSHFILKSIDLSKSNISEEGKEKLKKIISRHTKSMRRR